MKKFFTMLVVGGAICFAGNAEARSPKNTPEYEAEEKAIDKMKKHWGGFKVKDAQMRSNFKSISLSSENRTSGKQASFKVDVTQRQRRGGSYYYEVGELQPPRQD